jgi:hypothetical protein
MKEKKCDSCQKFKPIWKSHGKEKYCKSCWSCHSNNTPKPKAVKHYTIPAVSSKKAKLDRVYSNARKKHLELYSSCQAKLPGCGLTATDIHHKKGRGPYYLDTTTWLSVCRPCHTWIEEHPLDAKSLGFSESRL